VDLSEAFDALWQDTPFIAPAAHGEFHVFWNSHSAAAHIRLWFHGVTCVESLPSLFSRGFLPTMRLQPSQLPKIVGSGRVTSRRALFCCSGLASFLFDVFVDEAHQKFFHHCAH
jgi:hypothetical protein